MKLAKSLGLTFALVHAVGVILIQAGLLKYWEWAHMVTMQYAVQPFNVLTFIVGTAVAGAAGFIIGIIYEKIYQKVK